MQRSSSLIPFLCLLIAGCAPHSTLPAPTIHSVRLAAAPDQFMVFEDATIRYRDSHGAGTPVIVIHGFTRDLNDWLILGDSLAVNHRVIALDARGHGKSSKFKDPQHYGRQMADDVVHLMTHLGIQKAHLAGHSMGALIAANVAARYPKRVLSASLVAGPFATDSATLANATAPWIGRLESGAGLKDFFRWILPEWTEQLAITANDAALKANDVPALLGVMKSLGGLAVTAEVSKKSAVPVLIADGSKDPLLQQSRELASRWPGSRLIEVEGANHSSVIASPLILAAMRELMSKR